MCSCFVILPFFKLVLPFFVECKRDFCEIKFDTWWLTKSHVTKRLLFFVIIVGKLSVCIAFSLFPYCCFF